MKREISKRNRFRWLYASGTHFEPQRVGVRAGSQMALTFESCEPTALAEGGSFICVSIKKTRS